MLASCEVPHRRALEKRQTATLASCAAIREQSIAMGAIACHKGCDKRHSLGDDQDMRVVKGY